MYKQITPTCIGYVKKPAFWSPDDDISYGWGLYWIESYICPNSTTDEPFFYIIKSLPKSRMNGTCGTSNFEFVQKRFNDIVNFDG